MQVLNTYRIDAKKLNYNHPDKNVYNKVKRLFSILDEIILEKSISALHILSGTGIQLLNKENFEAGLRRINADADEFDKLQHMYYVLIKHKYFCINNSMESNNTIIIFITRSIVKYIDNDKERFLDMMDRLPMFYTFESVVDQLWEKYNEHIMHFIVVYGIFPYLFSTILDHRRICTYCGKVSNVTFIRCYGCRVTHYCSNLCQHYDHKDHKKICINIYDW